MKRSSFIFFIFLMFGFCGGVQAKNTPVAVHVALVHQENIPRTVVALGQLEAIQEVALSSQTAGKIKSINFGNGAEVIKGEPVVQLDDALAVSQYNIAKTSFAVSQQRYQRAKKMAQYLSPETLTTMAADVKTKQAQLNAAFVQVQQCKLSAPFSGQLGAFKFSEGDFVNPGDVVVRLVNTSQLQVDYSVQSDIKNQLKKGQSITVEVPQYPHKKFVATVNYISPVVDSDTRTVVVHALLENPVVKLKSKKNGKRLLIPGMVVNVQQSLSVDKSVSVVPDLAVLVDLQGHYVYVLKKGVAERVNVTLGQHIKSSMGILSGLQPGEKVVVAGQQKIDDGAPVTVVS
jgi:membrane fusion protein, multidrug efflux system